MKEDIIIINKPHSIVDVITNSSTELFIVDKSKTQEIYQEFLDLFADMHLDYESEVYRLIDYPDAHELLISGDYNPEDLYVINASYHNSILNKFINEFFHTINFSWID